MLVMRPAQMADLAEVQRLAADSPVGVTSLPDDAQVLGEKIAASEASFSAEVSFNGEESYFFVLEDSATGRLAGCSAIVASAGFSEPFYSFRNETFVHASRELKIHNKIHVLSLCHDLTGNSLLTSFYVERDLVNTPAGDLPPAQLAREAQRMARRVGLRCKVWGKPELERGGFGGILGVGAGSVNPPRLIELEYRGAGSATPIALTGKGIAFDSGGLSIKDAKGMETMKYDMGGAATILATMKAIARLKPTVNVIAAIPCAENLPSGSAQKPGDVITHRGGTTSEVLNTDAEGRLVLADALAYLAERKPKVIVDTATLTGACVVALGQNISGAMGNDDELIRQLIAAGDATGEPMWQLPLHQEYRQLIDSSVADVKNIGERWGGAITAALFLAEFVGDTPWCHIDMAGPGFSERGTDLSPRGSTGVPVRTLVRFVLDRAA